MAQIYTITAPSQPGLTPPPNVVPNFGNIYTLEPYQTMTIAACIIMTTVLVFARIYTKRFILKSLVWEDCKLAKVARESLILILFRHLRDRLG